MEEELIAAILAHDLDPDDVIFAALKYEGINSLLSMWRDEEDPKERDLIVSDIKELIDDINKTYRIAFDISFLDAVFKEGDNEPR